eukprot:scaffold25470_cov25-Tisochrysis_lutea.AAC.2
MRWICLGKVAENMSVWRSGDCGMPSCCTMRRIWGSNPMSSMRSASSSVRTVTQETETRPRSMRSTRRPGVATSSSHPRSRSRSWSRISAPP